MNLSPVEYRWQGVAVGCSGKLAGGIEEEEEEERSRVRLELPPPPAGSHSTRAGNDSTMREIVHIQAGQCGNQIGAKVRVDNCKLSKIL